MGRATTNLKRAASLLLLALVGFAGLPGCHFGRHYSVVPEQNQALPAQSGDRFFFELDENQTTGYAWRAACDDPDISVSLRHVAGRAEGGLVGVPGKAEVEIRVHRGYDGPSTIRFQYRRNWEERPIREFTITLYKRTGDRAFWE